jgi:hypothetical protein
VENLRLRFCHLLIFLLLLAVAAVVGIERVGAVQVDIEPAPEHLGVVVPQNLLRLLL